MGFGGRGTFKEGLKGRTRQKNEGKGGGGGFRRSNWIEME